MPAASCCTKAEYMSMTNRTTEFDEPDADADLDAGAVPALPPDAVPAFESPIVPSSTIAGRSLVAVVAIMTFLASLTAGAVMLVRAAASDWQSDVAREVTIQVRPASNRDVEADVARAAQIARNFPGVAEVEPYSREESARLLEPWLGSGTTLSDLPIPRIIAVRIAPNASPDFARLRMLLAEVPTASLDDHRSFVDRMRAMAGAAVGGGLAILALMLAATVLSVTFATRAAMVTNRPVIEVLHFVGAKNSYIAGHFQRHFLLLGLKGGLIGGGSAVALFALGEFVNRRFFGTAAGDQFGALFGSFSIGVTGYAMMLAQVVVIAAVTAWSSRRAVNRTIETIH
jgi:cell division transport system permease protein